MPCVIDFGSLNMDLSIACERIPQAGETVPGHDFLINPGGKGANQAVAASRLGAQVFLIGAVGNDVFGKQLVEMLPAAGVDKSEVRILDDISSGLAMITRTDSDNRIILNAGANHALGLDEVSESLSRVAHPADIFVTQLECGYRATLAALRKAHDQGLVTLFNPAPAMSLPDSIWDSVDMVCVNETECQTITGILPTDKATIKQGLSWFIKQGVPTAIITLGDKGAALMQGEIYLYQPALEVKVEDTTGAGDTFIGALAVMVAEHKDREFTLRWASCAAALTITKVGAQRSIPTRAEVDEFYSHIG